jgi:hypothetical protein
MSYKQVADEYHKRTLELRTNPKQNDLEVNISVVEEIFN